MNETNFCKTFHSNIFRLNGYHITDYSQKPIPDHYFVKLVKGTAIFKTEDYELRLDTGDIFYIPKGLTYQSQWFGENEKDIVFYSFGFKVSPISKPFVLQKIECDEKAKCVFNELCTEIPFTEKGIGKLYYFFSLVADGMRQARESHANPTVERAIELMTQNPYLKISDVAAACGISESGIYPLFKKKLRKTPNDVRLEILCDRAVTLLTTTDRSVQEISDSLGFSSTSYFRKILKHHTGKTPLKIRSDSDFSPITPHRCKKCKKK